MESLERLRGLQEDLIAFSSTRLATVDRLWHELEASVQDFRKLLDKPTKSNASRQSLASGKLTVNAEEYSVNEDFQQVALHVADTLDLDELEAAKLAFEAQGDPLLANQSPIPFIVSRFHDGRLVLLQDLRITLEEAVKTSEDTDDTLQAQFQNVVLNVLDVINGPASNGSVFTRKCLAAMDEVEKWQGKITEHIQAASVVGEVHGREFLELWDTQRRSLSQQHEALGAILAYLFKGNYTISEDLRKLLEISSKWDRLDFSLVHYLPAFSAAFTQYGTPMSSPHDSAKPLHEAIMRREAQSARPLLQPFQGTIQLLWLAGYSGYYHDSGSSPEPRKAGLDEHADQRAKAVEVALEDGALEFLLAVCASMGMDDLHLPARQELVNLLLREGCSLSVESDSSSDFFRILFMETLESFSESWITNMPDCIRRLKSEEDDRRLQDITAMQDGLSSGPQRDPSAPLHLECFLVLISFAFEHRIEAAEQFWDKDSNLFGFLQWASKRQTVPRVSAFCEMLCAISEGPYCADEAHKFLLDDTAPTSSRPRRSPQMNYEQMFTELQLYAYKVHDKPVSSQLPQARKVLPTDMNELESPVMLSCYLRLLAHMCRESRACREYVVEKPAGIEAVPTLLILSSGPVPSYLKASILMLLETLLTEKTLGKGWFMWRVLDQWVSSGPASFTPNLPKSAQAAYPPIQLLSRTLNDVTMTFEQSDSFVVLLRSLVAPPVDISDSATKLPFPEDLGASYRMPGIGPYIDVTSGQLFTRKLAELPDDGQIRIFRLHCLDLFATVLDDFNENYVAIEDGPLSAGTPHKQSEREIYAQRHPFGRTMEWLFTEEVVKSLMACTHHSIDDITAAAPNSLIVLGLNRSLEVLNLVLDLQPTYLDIVRPLIKSAGQSAPASVSTIAFFEEAIMSHPGVVSDLRLYASTDHNQLVLSSLALLQKLSSSRKLNSPAFSAGGYRARSRRIVDMLGPDTNSELVSLSLASKMQINIRELENGPRCPGYMIKDGVLAFLNSCLAQSELPNIAHLFLGFAKVGESLVTMGNSADDDGLYLLNAIINLAQHHPDGQDGSLVSWLIHIKSAALQALRQLWAAPLSSLPTVVELRKQNFLASQFSSQTLVSPDTLWDGYSTSEPSFWGENSADAVAEFLGHRAFLFEYAATELRSVTHSKLISLQAQTLAILTGRLSNLERGLNTHVTVFDLFDFAEINIGEKPGMGSIPIFETVDLDVCASRASDESTIFYDLDKATELLQARRHQLSADGMVKTPGDEEQILTEAGRIVQFLKATNRWWLMQAARQQAFHMWVELVVAMLEYCTMDSGARNHFSLHVLQLILPKLEGSIVEEGSETFELARLADALVISLTVSASTSPQDRIGSAITDKLFHLFKTCVQGITNPSTGSGLREIFYSICARYLSHLYSNRKSNQKAQRNSMECLKSGGSPLICALSDDAEDGIDTCRLSALSMLALMTSLARSERSLFVVDTMVKANMLEVLVEPIKYIAGEFQQAEPNDRKDLLAVLEARLSLLLEISRTREGATHIVDAGFLQAIRQSMLFRADPDLGIDVDNAKALHNYYELLSFVLRLLVSTFLSRGVQNEQCQFQMRNFLQDYRPNIVGLLKRYNGIGGKVSGESRAVLDKIVNSYIALMSMAGFVEFEEETSLEGLRSSGFT